MWEKHQRDLNEALNGDSTKKELEDLLAVHREKIKYLQHERLTHLLVTLTVAICTLLTFFATVFSQNIILLFPDALLTLLLLAYLIYYRKLEITVQRWYVVSDKIRNKIKKSSNIRS